MEWLLCPRVQDDAVSCRENGRAPREWPVVAGMATMTKGAPSPEGQGTVSLTDSGSRIVVEQPSRVDVLSEWPDQKGLGMLGRSGTTAHHKGQTSSPETMTEQGLTLWYLPTRQSA